MIKIDFTTKSELIPEYKTDKLGNKFTINNMGNIHSHNDLPAVINSKMKIWFKNGKYHRDNNLPAILWADGRIEYWENGIKIK